MSDVDIAIRNAIQDLIGPNGEPPNVFDVRKHLEETDPFFAEHPCPLEWIAATLQEMEAEVL